MYNYYKKVDTSVHSYAINDNTCFVSNEKSISKLVNGSVLELFQGKSNLQEIHCDHSICFVNEFEGSGIIVKNEEVVRYSDIGIRKVLSNEKIIGFQNDTTVVFNINSEEIETIIPNRSFKDFVYKNILFRKLGNAVQAFSLINKIEIWKNQLDQFSSYKNTFGEEKPHQISQFIGVWQNQLIILLTGGKFISLNIENGKLLWEKSEVTKNLTNQAINYGFGEPYHPFLDPDKGHIYILQGEVFIDFDLNALEAIYAWNVKDHQKEDFLFFRQTRIFKNQIYFTAFRDSNKGVDDTIGVFDIEKKEIIWQYTFQFDKGIFIPNSQDNIQVNETNLYVLDSSKTLHIFQKPN